jgi:hypothetical protein
MSGRSISIKSAFFAGIRVLGQLTYIPAHMKNGKEINARATIPVRANSHRGHDRQGQPGRKDDFKLTVWGKLADTCARSCSPGKCIDVVCEPNSYLGKVFNPDGSMRMDAAGQAIEVNKVGFTVREIVFGEESRKFVTEEIQAGKRPVGWDTPGTPDHQQWQNTLNTRKAIQWDGGPVFGYARVVIPQGQGIQLMGQAPAAPQQAPVYNAPAQQAPQNAPVYGQAPLPNQVNQALPPQGQAPANQAPAQGAQQTAVGPGF